MSKSRTAAQRLTSGEKRARLGEILRKRAQNQVRRFPLSFAQQRLWFLDKMEGGNTSAYTIPVVLLLKGPLDVTVAERSLNEISRRHESLRSTFDVRPGDGTVEQIVHPCAPVKLTLIDISADNEPLEEARRLAIQEARTTFDLRAGPLFRAKVLKLGDRDWVLLLTMHHIISDGWSVNLVISELAALYDAYSRGDPSPLAELQVQYADFAHWQRERLSEEFLEKQMAYWRERLRGPLPLLELPTRNSRPSAHSLRGSVRVWQLSQHSSHASMKLSRSLGVTPFMTLIAAFVTLLYRYTGQEDLLVGTPIANRNRREIEDIIGLFINTLIFRISLSGRPTVRELLARVKEAALGAYAHQEVPFEKLVEDLQPERDISRTPLFQVMFVLQPPMPDWKTTELVIKPWVLEGSTSKFEMTLSIIEEADGRLQGWLEYNTDLFDRSTIDRLIGHYETLLAAMAADPEQAVATLPLLTQRESRKLLLEWNDTAAAYSPERCMHELVDLQALRTPDSTAVVFQNQHMTYRQLTLEADRLASHLSAMGVRPEERVGIAMERCSEMVVALLAVLKAGAAYLPLDPAQPRERLNYMLQDSGARVLLVQDGLVKDPPGDNLRIIGVDEQAGTVEEKQAQRVRHGSGGLSPANLGYVIYTSGSTGQPKGVMSTHRGLCNLVLWMQEAFPLSSSDRMVQRTAFSFDASIWEFFWPLICGATLVVASPEAQKDGELLLTTLVEEQITVLQIVQSLLDLLLEMDEMRQCRALNHVFCGGESMSRSVYERFYRLPLSARLHNVYGPTEASMHVTHYACPPLAEDNPVPIGTPIGNIRMYVLDGHLQPVPVGVPGSLYIGGVGLARGYLNRQELTAERFIPDPFAASAGESLYLTGDLARYREEGNIEFLGRNDQQVKIRGFRIEPGEVEANLREHPAVFQAVVLARENTAGQKRLVAYVVLKSPEVTSASDLRAFLSGKLPEHMIPSAFIFLDVIPLMSSGKVDLKALPDPAQSRDELGQPYVEPRNEVELKLAAIFREVLGVEKVGVDDNFFELGGHSLNATQVMTRIREILRVDLPLRRLFETPTIAGLGTAVECGQPADDDVPIEIVHKADPRETAPLEAMLDDLTTEELESLLAEIAARKKK